jgi:hypothetical protein
MGFRHSQYTLNVSDSNGNPPNDVAFSSHICIELGNLVSVDLIQLGVDKLLSVDNVLLQELLIDKIWLLIVDKSLSQKSPL